VINGMKLNDKSFELTEVAGRKLFECVQCRIMNLILCVINGIPLKRDNQSGKNCRWMEDINANNRGLLYNTRQYLKSIDTHKSYRGDQQNHYPLSDLRDGVVQDAYEYQRNKAYASRISSRKNDYCDDKTFSGSMTDPIKIETNNELRPGNHVVNKCVAALDASLSTSNDVMVNYTMSTTNEDDQNIIPKRKSYQSISCVM